MELPLFHSVLLLAVVTLLPTLSHAISTSLNQTSICNQLDRRLPGQVFFPNSTTYSASVESYFALQIRLSPRCIIRPSTAQDVSTAVKLLASKQSSRFAVRSGGHSPNAGFSNIEDGVTFDLRSLQSVSLDKDQTVAYVGSGAIWGNVYQELEHYGLSVVGGRGASIGVGGLTTGGGISAYSKRRGWACDNVANFELVLASGKLINANATHNADLFQALKGGQNNFGVVTRLDLYTHQQGPFLGGAIYYDTSANDDIFQAYTEFKQAVAFDPDEEVEQSFIFLGATGTYITTNNLFHAASATNPNGLSRWTEVKPQIRDTLRVHNMSEFAREIDELQYQDKIVFYGNTVFKITPSILKQVYNLWEGATKDTFSALNGVNSVMTWQSVPPVPRSSKNSFGFERTATPEKDEIMLLISNYYDTEADTEAVTQRSLTLIQDIEELAAKSGSFIPFRYPNYAHYSQRVIESWGEESVQFLKRVSRKYDPNGTFQNQVDGGFKLRNVGS